MNNNLKLAYLPKIGSTLGYFALLVIVFILFLGRKNEKVQIEFLMKNFPEFYSHISNFTISFMLILVIGYLNILQTGKLYFSIFMICVCIIANLVYENFIPILNTPDKIDAYYGIIGSILPLIYLILHQKWGIKPNPLS
jgi:hypothetical protein